MNTNLASSQLRRVAPRCRAPKPQAPSRRAPYRSSTSGLSRETTRRNVLYCVAVRCRECVCRTGQCASRGTSSKESNSSDVISRVNEVGLGARPKRSAGHTYQKNMLVTLVLRGQIPSAYMCEDTSLCVYVWYFYVHVCVCVHICACDKYLHRHVHTNTFHVVSIKLARLASGKESTGSVRRQLAGILSCNSSSLNERLPKFQS